MTWCSTSSSPAFSRMKPSVTPAKAISCSRARSPATGWEKQVASEKITLGDYALRGPDGGGTIAIYVDDEGTQCRDVTIIEKGVRKGFLIADKRPPELGAEPTATRARLPSRRAAQCACATRRSSGEDKCYEIIVRSSRGFHLKRPLNGQADLTSEFMFGVCCGYDIRNGKLACAGATPRSPASPSTCSKPSRMSATISNGLCPAAGRQETAHRGRQWRPFAQMQGHDRRPRMSAIPGRPRSTTSVLPSSSTERFVLAKAVQAADLRLCNATSRDAVRQSRRQSRALDRRRSLLASPCFSTASAAGRRSTGAQAGSDRGGYRLSPRLGERGRRRRRQ